MLIKGCHLLELSLLFNKLSCLLFEEWNQLVFVFWVFIVCVPFHFSLFRRCSNNKSPQRWRSGIKQQIVLLGNWFHVFFASSVLKIASKGVWMKLWKAKARVRESTRTLALAWKKFQEIFSNRQVFIACFESINADIFNIFSYLQFTVGIRYFSQLNWISTVFRRGLSDCTAIFQHLYLVVRVKLLWKRRVRTVFIKVE